MKKKESPLDIMNAMGDAVDKKAKKSAAEKDQKEMPEEKAPFDSHKKVKKPVRK